MVSMDKKNNRKKQAKALRIFRKVHRITGATLFVFFFIVAATGLMLGWKKNTGDLLGSKTYQGSTTTLEGWLPLKELERKAASHLRKEFPLLGEVELDRIDIRHSKGVAKFIFKDYYGVQVDGVTGALLRADKRHADFIENVHDASILDDYWNGNGYIKLFYTTVMGMALLVFTISGFWLWYGPKKLKRTV